MKEIVKNKLIILLLFGINVCLAQNKKDVVSKYLRELKSDVQIDSVVFKYHPLAIQDQSLLTEFRKLMSERRMFLQRNSKKKIEIINVTNLSNYSFLSGLNWQEGIYVVLIGDEKLMTVLVEENRLVSTILITKGKKKYFLKM